MTKRVVVPPVIAFLLVAVYLLVESFGFRGLAAAEPSTVSESAAMGHAARALQLIAEGQNPNDAQRIAPGILGPNEYYLRPLEAAIVGRHIEMVRLLQRSGAAKFDMTRAICLATLRLPQVLPDLTAAATDASASPMAMVEAIERCR